MSFGMMAAVRRRWGIWLRKFPVWFWFLAGAIGICAFTVGLIVSMGPRQSTPVAGNELSPSAAASTGATSSTPSERPRPQAPVAVPTPTKSVTATVTVTPVPRTVAPRPSSSAATPVPGLPSGLASAIGGLLGLGRTPAGFPASGVDPGAAHSGMGDQQN